MTITQDTTISHYLAHTDTGHVATHRCRNCGLGIYRSNFTGRWNNYYVTPSTTCPGYELDNPPQYPWVGTEHSPIYQPESGFADYADVVGSEFNRVAAETLQELARWETEGGPLGHVVGVA